MHKLIILTLTNNATLEYVVPAEQLDHELAALDTIITNPIAVHQVDNADTGDITIVPSRNILYYSVVGADLVDACEYEAIQLASASEQPQQATEERAESAVSFDETGVTLAITSEGVSAEDIKAFLAAIRDGAAPRQRRGKGWRAVAYPDHPTH